MGTFSVGSYAVYSYYNFGGFLDWFREPGSPTDLDTSLSEVASPDNLFTPGEDVQFAAGATYDYLGTYSYNDGSTTHEFIVLRTQFATGTNGKYILASTQDTPPASYPFGFAPGSVVSANTALVCFAAGTGIATTDGEIPVERLVIGQKVLTADQREIAVKWIGRQTVTTSFHPAERLTPVRFAAGALGHGIPHSDLTVTADHAMLVGGVLCNAGALVNGTTIRRVPLAEMGERYTVYHVETEDHEIILANGAPAETFIDNINRRVFENHAEFEALYGQPMDMVELALPRAMSVRQVPLAIRKRLGLDKVA